jgi:hypothetical protein
VQPTGLPNHNRSKTAMNAYSKPSFPSSGVILLAGLLVLGGSPRAVLATQFEPPDLTGFQLHDQWDMDGDGDGKNETHIMHYLNPNGDSLSSMTTRGRTWAWSLNSHDNETGGPKNYVIRDSDCDGVYDEVYGLDDEFHVPDCLE